MSTDVVGLRALAEKATRGPWKWTGHRVSTLEGRAGDPESYEYDVEVIEAEHYGECGCRSACTLDLIVKQVDADYIAAANPSVVLALLDEITTLRAENERLTRALQATDDFRVADWQKLEAERDEAEAALDDRDARIKAALAKLAPVHPGHDGVDPEMVAHDYYRRAQQADEAWSALSGPAVPVPQDNPEATREQIGGE